MQLVRGSLRNPSLVTVFVLVVVVLGTISLLKIPADLDEETTQTIRAHALTAFGCCGLSGLARVDFLVERGSGRVYLNEVNTLPGFTSISMFPKLWPFGSQKGRPFLSGACHPSTPLTD